MSAESSDPFDLDAPLDALRPVLDALCDRWRADRGPLRDALLPFAEPEDGSPPLDDVEAWLSVGRAVAASGMGDLPAEVVRHRRLPAAVEPTPDPKAEFGAWAVFPAAVTVDPAAVRARLDRLRQWRDGAGDPTAAADRIDDAVMAAAGMILAHWDQRAAGRYADELEAELTNWRPN